MKIAASKKSFLKASSLNSVINFNDLSEGKNPLVGVLRDLPDAVLLIDAAGLIFYANESAERLFGFSGGEQIYLTAILPKNSKLNRRSALYQHWLRFRAVHKISDFETQLIAKNNRLVTVNTSQTAIFDLHNQLVGIAAVVKDITKTRETEQRISRRNAQLFALIEVAEAVTAVSSVEQLLEQVLNGVLGVTALNSGCVHLVNEDEECLELATHSNLSVRAREMLERFELGEGVIGTAAILAQTMFVSDTAADRRVARPVASEHLGALAGIPLVGRGGAVRGVMTLFHRAPRVFTEHESSMLTAIGKQIGIALERNQLLRDVTVARREWEQTFDSMTDGVSIHAPSGKIRRANSSLAQMFATQPEKLIGIRCCELYHGSPTPRPDCTIMRTVTTRAAQRVELTDRLHGRVLRVITDPIIGANDRVAGVVCTTRDVTDEKLIERRLVQQERISAVGEIAAGIAHEVGTPLNIISANAEFLLRNSGADGDAEELLAIREQAHSITNLVRQLLDFSRDYSPNFAPVNINNLIERTINLLNHQLQRADVKCETSLARYLPTVDGDTAQIQQVLFNLITNACQAMEKIDRKRVLRIVTDSALMPTETFAHPHIVINVTDNGSGIPAAALPDVFNPFFTANKEGGTGLGLAISHRIIQKHLGTLAISNNPDYGVTVRIRLPLAQA